MDSEKIISLKGILKEFKNGSEMLTVLKDLDFFVDKGEFISIVGKSGSGKSTLLNIISMLDAEYEGDFVFENIDVSKKTKNEIFDIRTRNISYVFQSFNLIPELNILQNVEMPLGYQGLSKKNRQDIAIQNIERVGLKGMEKKKPHQLSGGEQQRVSIARALTINPKLLICDEPTGNLDENTAEEILKLFIDLNSQGSTILMVTHDIDIANLAQKSYRLEKGNLHLRN